MHEQRLRRIVVVAGLLGIGAVALVGINARTHLLNRWYDDRMLDSWNHYLPCDRWPTPDAVYAILAQHEEMVRRIEDVHPGNAGVEVDEAACPGGADIVIWYASHQDRLEIEAIIGSDRFFGAPYRLQNR